MPPLPPNVPPSRSTTWLKTGAQREDKEAAAAQVNRAQGAVQEVNSYIRETVLTASADGEVTQIFPQVGELVGTGAPIMNVALMNDMWVQLQRTRGPFVAV